MKHQRVEYESHWRNYIRNAWYAVGYVVVTIIAGVTVGIIAGVCS